MIRLATVYATLGAALLLTACNQPVTTGSSVFSGFSGFAPTPYYAAPRGQHDPQLDACRAQATQAVQWRDRGQLMRIDEIENRRDGNITVAPPSRAESDRLGATLERDRLVAACMAANTPPQPQGQPVSPGGGARLR